MAGRSSDEALRYFFVRLAWTYVIGYKSRTSPECGNRLPKERVFAATWNLKEAGGYNSALKTVTAYMTFSSCFPMQNNALFVKIPMKSDIFIRIVCLF